MKKYLEKYNLNDVHSFQDKIRLIKDNFYIDKFGVNDVFKSSTRTENLHPVLELFGIDFCLFVFCFVFCFFEKERFQNFDRSYDCIELICLVNNLFKYLDSMNKRGYVNESVLNKMFMSQVTYFFFWGFGYDSIKSGNSELPYTMWYILIFINFYYLIVKELECLKKLNCVDLELNEFEFGEVVSELEYFRVELLYRIDLFLKLQVKKRGITIVQNTYCGFDSEYVSLDSRKNLNELVSVQKASQDRTIIKIPLYNP